MIELTKDNAVSLIDKITPEWLAGFFDGDGCVCISYYQNTHRLELDFTQVDTTILILISIKFPKGNLSDKSHLKYVNSNCLEVLNYIKDYVIIKKYDVDIALEYFKTIVSWGCRLKEGDKEIREELRIKLTSIR